MLKDYTLSSNALPGPAVGVFDNVSVFFYVKSGKGDFVPSGMYYNNLSGTHEPQKEQVRHSYTYRAYLIVYKTSDQTKKPYALALTDKDENTIDHIWTPMPRNMGDGIFMQPIVATAPAQGAKKDGDKFIFDLKFNIMYLGSLVSRPDSAVRHEIKHTLLYQPSTESGSIGLESSNIGKFYERKSGSNINTTAYELAGNRTLKLPSVALKPGDYYYRAIVTHCDFGGYYSSNSYPPICNNWDA